MSARLHAFCSHDAVLLCSSKNIDRPSKDCPLPTGAVATIVERLITGLDDYVFPERALILKHCLGKYQQIHSPEALADRLTTDLRTVGHDKHLTIFYAPPMPHNDTR